MDNGLALYWFRDSNFGDALNEVIFPKYNVPVTYADVWKADAAGLGSILNLVPPSFSGVVLGAGFMWEHNYQCFMNADIQLVRGKLTAERCFRAGQVLLGDPGLLVKMLFPGDSCVRYTLGLIPHYVDQQDPVLAMMAKCYGKEAKMIDIRGSTEDVVEAISECECIASSSLHGLVAADALGKPNVWLVLSQKVLGNGFKFRDYFSAFAPGGSVRAPFTPRGDESLSSLLEKMTRPCDSVNEVIHGLDEFFQTLSMTGLLRR